MFNWLFNKKEKVKPGPKFQFATVYEHELKHNIAKGNHPVLIDGWWYLDFGKYNPLGRYAVLNMKDQQRLSEELRKNET